MVSSLPRKEDLAEIKLLLIEMQKTLQFIKFSNIIPQDSTLLLLSERTTNMATRIFVAQIQLPALSAVDVVKRELTLKVGENEPKVLEIVSPEIDALISPEFEVELDSELSVTLVEVDSAGNKSEPNTQSFIVKDTLAPPKPGVVGLVMLREVSPNVPVDDTVTE